MNEPVITKKVKVKEKDFQESVGDTVYQAYKADELDIESLDEETRHKLRDFLISKLVGKAYDDFETYVELMAPEILPEGYIPGRHIKVICKDLQAIEKSIVDTYSKHRKKERAKPKGLSTFFLPVG